MGKKLNRSPKLNLKSIGTKSRIWLKAETEVVPFLAYFSPGIDNKLLSYSAPVRPDKNPVQDH